MLSLNRVVPVIGCLALVVGCAATPTAGETGAESAPPVQEATEVEESVDTQETVEEDPVAEPEAPAPVLSGVRHYVIRQETAEGFKLRAELEVYDAISGLDLELLEAAWGEVGGTGEPPCLDADIPNDMVVATVIHTQTSAYAFGRLTIVDETEGDFAPPSLGWQFVSGRPQPASEAAMGVGFSSGNDCRGMTTGGFLLTPNMSGDRWGPVPTVFAFDGIFTPNHPAGDVAALQGTSVGVNPFGAGATITDGNGNEVTGIPMRLASTP